MQSLAMLPKLMHLVLSCILASGMQETQTKCIHMPDFTVAEIKFFLRFAYTGHANSSD
jgi:hypothetical protein